MVLDLTAPTRTPGRPDGRSFERAAGTLGAMIVVLLAPEIRRFPVLAGFTRPMLWHRLWAGVKEI